MEHAIDYISREDKALNLNEFKQELKNRLDHVQSVNTNIGERATCINCTARNAYKDFENMRKIFRQDKGVIAHHYYQSFQKDDDVTPELAHQIGVELAKKMFPNFQVVVSTHTDREHVHNHLIVNSCNTLTGQKWYSNKKSLSDIRRESDKLCLQNGLGVITKNSKYKGIDRTTYQLGMKGKSWKINLVQDLEEAAALCRSKDEFIKFLSERDYTVRYKDLHITITKNGEKKGIRVDTLAKQFGDKFKKENLEKKMGYYSPPSPEIIKVYQPERKNKSDSSVKGNWEHYEQWIFKQQSCYPSTKNNIIRDSQTERLIKSAERSLFYSRNIFDFILRAILFLTAKAKRRSINYAPEKYRKVRTLKLTKNSEYINYGNISYNELTHSAGDNYSIKVSMEKLLKIVNQPILYSARIDKENSSVTITVKEKDKEFLAEILELNKIQNQLNEQNDRLSNQKIYKELKQAAEQSGEKLQYLIITPDQKQILKDNYIQFAYFEKGDKMNIAFLPEKADLIKKLIYPKPEKETEQKRNNLIYAQIKKNAALTGDKPKYRTKLTKEQLQLLKKSGIIFAYFVNSENKSLYNIAFEKKYEDKVRTVLASANLNKLT